MGIEPLADVLPQDELSSPDGADVGRRETASLALMADGRLRTQGDVQMSFFPWRR